MHDTAKRPAEPARKPIFLRLVALIIAAVLFVGFLSLGIWQIERRAWKLDLIARVDQRVHAPAQPVPVRAQWPNITIANDEYRHVQMSGEYLYQSEVLVKALTERGSGYWVMTPMRAADNTITFINRGFVPDNLRDRAARQGSEIAGQTSVTGLLRMPEPGGFFLRPNDVASDQWNSRDIAAFALKRRLDNVAPYFIDADATPNPGSLPIGGLTVVSFRNTHLTYAITWFALALMVAGATIFVWRSEIQLKRAERGQAL